jgi:hypothetical protein
MSVSVPQSCQTLVTRALDPSLRRASGDMVYMLKIGCLDNVGGQSFWMLSKANRAGLLQRTGWLLTLILVKRAVDC